MTDHRTKQANMIRQAATAFDPVSAALQQLHQAVTSEELPDDFLKILEEIDAKIAAALVSPAQ